jgi:hypothetical protein
VHTPSTGDLADINQAARRKKTAHQNSSLEWLDKSRKYSAISLQMIVKISLGLLVQQLIKAIHSHTDTPLQADTPASENEIIPSMKLYFLFLIFILK